MDANERKQFLQGIGALPQDPDGLMNPFAGSASASAPLPAAAAQEFGRDDKLWADVQGTAPAAPKPAADAPEQPSPQGRGPSLGKMLADAGNAYLRAKNGPSAMPTAQPSQLMQPQAPAPGDQGDARSRLIKMVTPDLIGKLRKRAGLGGGEGNDQP